MTENSSQYYIIYIPALLPDSHICFQIKRAVARLSSCLSHLEKILLFMIFYMASGIHAGLLIECGEVVQDFLRNFGGRRSPMAWTLLLVAGFFEIVWATALKYTDGFTRLWPSIATVLAMAISMVCMSFALRAIPMGTAYAVWTGIGAVGTVLLGILLFDEPRNALRLLCITLIILGIAGLKLSDPSP